MDREFIEQLIGPGEAAEAILQAHEQVVGDFRGQLRRQAVDHAVRQAVTAAGGRSEKAIRALLDEAAIAGAEDVTAAAGQAVQNLKAEQPYLFGIPQVYSAGTGTDRSRAVTSEDIAKMTMAEYRRYRRN